MKGDIHKLVDTMLGLWAMCATREAEGGTIGLVATYVRSRFHRVFPVDIFGDLATRVEVVLEERPELRESLKLQEAEYVAENASRDRRREMARKDFTAQLTATDAVIRIKRGKSRRHSHVQAQPVRAACKGGPGAGDGAAPVTGHSLELPTCCPAAVDSKI